ncbi:MAG: helix-turn-helix domain-containing protein [Sphingomonadaceae bacterium]
MSRPIPTKSLRLVLAGEPGSELSRAAEMALSAGAGVTLAASLDGALDNLREHGADIVMIDVRLDAPRLIAAMKAERIVTPVVACGVEASAELAVAAIRAGARDYVPLPPDRELIAAALLLVASTEADDADARGIDALVGQSVAQVERELILKTLDKCSGNRTSASAILGISVRTMRNKLREFEGAGFRVRRA